jgi:hypothetical protein
MVGFEGREAQSPQPLGHVGHAGILSVSVSVLPLPGCELGQLAEIYTHSGTLMPGLGTE